MSDKIDSAVKGVKNIRKQFDTFFQQGGKWIFLSVITTVGILLTGAFIPIELLIYYFFGIATIVMGIIVFVFWRIISKSVRKLIVKIDAIQEQLTEAEIKIQELESIVFSLRGEIHALRYYTPYAIIQMKLPEFQIIQANQNFMSMTGWTTIEFNEKVEQIELNQRNNYVTSLLFDEKSREIIKNLFEEQLTGDITPKKIKKICLKNREGKSIPVIIQTHLLKNHNEKVFHFFISDETFNREAIDTIEFQFVMFKEILTTFGTNYAKREEAQELIKKLSNMVKEELKVKS